MSAVHEKFNIDRHISIENDIDPTGKKWEIKGTRGSALVCAQPNPGTATSAIPAEFAGQWTSPSTLKEKITHWLNVQWDKSDRAALESSMKGKAPAPAVVEPKQTPEESLATLDPEILAELGDIIAVEAVEKPVAPKKKATRKKATK